MMLLSAHVILHSRVTRQWEKKSFSLKETIEFAQDFTYSYQGHLCSNHACSPTSLLCMFSGNANVLFSRAR